MINRRKRRDSISQTSSWSSTSKIVVISASVVPGSGYRPIPSVPSEHCRRNGVLPLDPEAARNVGPQPDVGPKRCAAQ